MAFVRTALTKEGYFVPNESDLGVKPSEFNTVAENDYRPDSFTKLAKTAIYGGGLLLISGLLAGCAPKPPGLDGGGGGDGNNNSNTDSLCPNLLRLAAANSVDVASRLPAWQAADRVELEQDFACFAPASASLTIGEILPVGPNAGDEVIQLAWSRGGEVIPLLAVPGAQIDDLQLVQFFDPKTSQWEALSPDQARTQLTAVNINSATGDIEAEESGVIITATRDFNNNISFQLVNPDNTQVVLTAEQVKNNLALASWLTQVENLLKGQEVLTFDVAPGIDVGNIGEKYSLPQEVFAAARERQLAPIEAEGSIAAACDQANCTVMLTDVLVSGAKLQPATDGKVIYGFDNQAGSEALFRFTNLPEGVRATAFVAQEGNPWGLIPGTVVVWFWEGGSKGPATILNPDNPLQIMADKPNSISLTAIDNGLLITRIGPDGAVIDEQTVSFLPPLPSEFLAQFNGTEFAVAGGGLTYAVPGGETVNVPGQFNGNSFEFIVNGAAVSAERNNVAVWDVYGNHLVVKGENGLPAYQFNPETKVWETVEQTSIIDAFGNNVPGWVVETSAVWEGEPTQAISTGLRVYDFDYDEEYGLNYGGMAAVNLKQWKLVEFVAINGTKMQNLVADFTFLNAKNQIITVRGRTRDIDSFPESAGFRNARDFIDSLTIGGKYWLDFFWVSTRSTLSPQELAKIIFRGELEVLPPLSWLDQVPCKTEADCPLEIGQLGAKKFSQTYLRDIANGVYGNFVDLSENAWIGQSSFVE